MSRRMTELMKDKPQRRAPEEVAADEDPGARADRLERGRLGFKLRAAGKYRLSVNVSREMMGQVRVEATRRGLTINRLVELLLEKGLSEK
jgi:hypothetical protein